jgi:hypothetical protein
MTCQDQSGGHDPGGGARRCVGSSFPLGWPSRRCWRSCWARDSEIPTKPPEPDGPSLPSSSGDAELPWPPRLSLGFCRGIWWRRSAERSSCPAPAVSWLSWGGWRDRLLSSGFSRWTPGTGRRAHLGRFPWGSMTPRAPGWPVGAWFSEVARRPPWPASSPSHPRPVPVTSARSRARRPRPQDVSPNRAPTLRPQRSGPPPM